MYNHFNELSPSEVERLAMLAEEAAEVIQVVNKILRHGYDAVNPTLDEGQQITNRLHLAIEVGQFIAVASELTDHKDINRDEVTIADNQKMNKARQWMHHYEPVDLNKKGVWEE